VTSGSFCREGEDIGAQSAPRQRGEERFRVRDRLALDELFVVDGRHPEPGAGDDDGPALDPSRSHT